jgi:hypothetical protein
MTAACQSGLTFVVALLTLLGAANGVGWQGTGNMSASNMTSVWSFIHTTYDNVPTKYGEIHFNQTAAVEGFVTYLNGLWDPSWNVVGLDTVASSDAVLYGYAFNSHWIWINNYASSGFVFGFVIWKDYKCGGYQTVGDSLFDVAKGLDMDPFKTSIKNCVSAFSTGYTMNIWDLASQFMKKLQSTAPFNVGDYSIILSNNADSTAMYARICMMSNLHTIFSFGVGANLQGYGKYLLFQTRT